MHMLMIYLLATLGWVFGKIYLSHCVRTRGVESKTKYEIKSSLPFIFSAPCYFSLAEGFLLLVLLLLNESCYFFPVFDFPFTDRKRVKDVRASSNIHKELYLYSIWSVEKLICTFLDFLHFFTSCYYGSFFTCSRILPTFCASISVLSNYFDVSYSSET